MQFLLPSSERALVMDFLRLLKKVTRYQNTSHMSAENLSICTAVTFFGPHAVDGLVDVNGSRKCRIETVANLIRLVDHLDGMPVLIYNGVRDRVRVALSDPYTCWGISGGNHSQELASQPNTPTQQLGCTTKSWTNSTKNEVSMFYIEFLSSID